MSTSEVPRAIVPRRYVIQGPSGSGKSTLARALATTLDAPYLELDSLYHQPQWTRLDDEMFRDKVGVFVRRDRWVSDGNYRVVRDLLWDRADVIVFIELPKYVVIARLLRRTLRRGFRREELWNGNRESLRSLLSRDPERNIVLWSWNTYSQYRQVPHEARAQASHAVVKILRGADEVAMFLRGIAS